MAAGVEDVAQAVAQQVEGEDGDHDRDAGEDRDPRRGFEIGAAFVEHVAPGRGGRLGREAQVAERGLDEDRLRQGHRALDHERREHVGQHVLERDHPAGGPERADGLHVFLFALGQHRPAHHAGEERHVDDRDGDDRAVDPGAAHRRDAHRQEEARDAEEDVQHPVDHVVPAPAQVAGGEAEHAAGGHRHRDRGDRHVEGDAGAVDHAAQHVAAEAVGAKEGLRAGPGLDEVEVLLVGVLGRDGAGEDRDRHDESHA